MRASPSVMILEMIGQFYSISKAVIPGGMRSGKRKERDVTGLNVG